ncbi:DUF5954 family protein [Streptomyces sp. NPDC048639]|uniref:DUF5954 family protein n=1 Tax=Streptomyces sp. NPDC048639 TaxID=3365581 RepID=UPI003711D54F
MTHDAGRVPPVPEHLVIKVTHRDDPVSAVTEHDAWEAVDAFPYVAGIGPVFGCAEEFRGRWRILTLGDGFPQMARDSLGAHFRLTAKEADEAGDGAMAAELMAAALRLDWEVVNELTVARRRFRIIRTDQFTRMGDDGPEPPRPTDPDREPAGESRAFSRRTKGFLIDPTAATGVSDGLLRLELLPLVYTSATVPPAVRADSLRALETHPGGVLLPTEFAVAEEVGGRWQPMAAAGPAPQSARDTLAYYFREMGPRILRLNEAERAQFARAADRLDAERCDELAVLGRRFRVVRVQQLIRVGPDGPEPPRSSDYDPYPPSEVQAQQLREEGALDEEDA